MSVRGYQKQNSDRFIAGIKVFAKGVIQPQLLQVLIQKAQMIVSAIDSGTLIPEYTANLHDATGIGIYVDGGIARFLPTKKATKMTKSGFDGVNHYQINGSEFLQQAISEASGRFSKGTWFVIFSAVPYAFHINKSGSPLGRGQGFFKAIADMSLDEILAGLQPIAGSITVTPTML